MAEDRLASAPPSAPRETFDPAYARRLEDPERFRTLSPETIVSFIDAPSGAVVVDDLRRILGTLAPGAADAERLLVRAGFVVERTLKLPYRYAFFGRV